MAVLVVRYYETADGHSPFAEWFAELDPIARAKVAAAIARMEQGNLSRVKSVGQGVLEYKIYFGRDGEQLVILLIGGTKKRQQRDIKDATAYWRDYKQSRRTARR